MSKEIDSLNEVISADRLETLDIKADKKRRKYLEFQSRENARGLPFVRNMYEKLSSVIMFEEIYYPLNNTSTTSQLLDDKTDTVSNFQYNGIQVMVKTHIVFILHGYLGEPDDMEKISNMVLQKCPYAKIHLIR